MMRLSQLASTYMSMLVLGGAMVVVPSTVSASAVPLSASLW